MLLALFKMEYTPTPSKPGRTRTMPNILGPTFYCILRSMRKLALTKGLHKLPDSIVLKMQHISPGLTNPLPQLHNRQVSPRTYLSATTSHCYIVGLTLYPKPCSTLVAPATTKAIADATIKNSLGGVNKINFGCSGKQRRVPTA
jgi:hypothetical protein